MIAILGGPGCSPPTVVSTQASRNIADTGEYIGDSSLVSAAAPTRITSVPGRRMNATGPGLGFLPDTLVLSGNDSSGVISV